MLNQQIAKLFREIADFLEMEGVAFKPIAYQRAAWGLEALEHDIEDVYNKEGLEGLEKKVPGVGKDLALKIEEYIKTDRIKELEELKKKTPVDVVSLTKIEGIGVKTVKKLYEGLGIKNLSDLEKAATEKKIQALPGFSAKKEENILKGIAFLQKEHGRMLLSQGWAMATNLANKLTTRKEVERVEIVGSLARMKETIGDIDILAISKNTEETSEFFASLPEVFDVQAKGPAKTNVRLKTGVDADLRIFAPDEFGAAMQYFIGSKEHNIALRTFAEKKGYKLNEYGLWKENKKIAGKNEKEIYTTLGMQYPPPEIRENTGEIEAALRHKLPDLISYGSLKGDLQVQTSWSDGEHSLREMAQAAIDAGLQYIGITDHSKSLQVAGGLNEKRLEEQFKEIDELNKEFKGKLRILKSAEIDIHKDGSLDMSDEMLSRLDFALATVHINRKMSEAQMTQRIISAMKHPLLDILGHPTGRLVLRREPYAVNIEAVIDAAVGYGVVLEINAYPERLDLKDVHIRLAVKKGATFAISSDAHNKHHFTYLRFGIAQARRGWVEKNAVVNTLPVEKFLAHLKRNA